MTALLHFKEKVHRKDLARAEAISTIDVEVSMPRIRASGFLEEKHIDRRQSYPHILSRERTLFIPLSFFLHSKRRSRMIT